MDVYAHSPIRLHEGRMTDVDRTGDCGIGIHRHLSDSACRCIPVDTSVCSDCDRNMTVAAEDPIPSSPFISSFILCVLLSPKQDRMAFKTTSPVVTILSMELFYPYRIITLHIFIAIISCVARTTRCLLSTSRCLRKEVWAVTMETNFINRARAHARPRLQPHVL